jgi:hypothetical protein
VLLVRHFGLTFSPGGSTLLPAGDFLRTRIATFFCTLQVVVAARATQDDKQDLGIWPLWLGEVQTASSQEVGASSKAGTGRASPDCPWRGAVADSAAFSQSYRSPPWSRLVHEIMRFVVLRDLLSPWGSPLGCRLVRVTVKVHGVQPHLPITITS